MHITNISEAKASLSHLIQVVQKSKEPIIIGKAGKPVAILSAYDSESTDRKLGGSWEGNVSINDDINETGEELIDSFYNSKIFPTKE